MVKIEAARARIFKRIFVCKRCNAKIRADPRQIAEKKVRCRKCKGSVFRPKSRKTKK